MEEHDQPATQEQGQGQGQEQGQAAPEYASQFAHDLARALVDPVIRSLLLSLIREGVRLENAARAQSVSPAPPRGSTKTSWVGDALRRQQAQEQGSQ